MNTPTPTCYTRLRASLRRARLHTRTRRLPLLSGFRRSRTRSMYTSMYDTSTVKRDSGGSSLPSLGVGAAAAADSASRMRSKSSRQMRGMRPSSGFSGTSGQRRARGVAQSRHTEAVSVAPAALKKQRCQARTARDHTIPRSDPRRATRPASPREARPHERAPSASSSYEPAPIIV